MIAIRTAGVVVAAGLVFGCQSKREQPQVAAPEPAPMQAAESLRQSLVRANPDARVGIVAATVGRFAAVREVPAGNVAEGATVQILDPGGEVVGYGLVRAVKDDTIHVLYQGDTRRGPAVGDLVMPTSDAGMPAEEMPASETMQPAAETTEPSLLPPRRGAATEAPTDAAPAEAQPAPAANETAPQQPAPTVTEEAPPADFQPAQPADDKPAMPPVEGATDAAEPAPQPAGEPAAEPAPQPAGEPSPGDTNGTAGGEPAPTPQDAAGDAAKDAGPGAADGKAPEAETPGLNK